MHDVNESHWTGRNLAEELTGNFGSEPYLPDSVAHSDSANRNDSAKTP